MSEVRLKYGELAPEGLAKMREMEHYLNNGAGLEASLRELVRLRASLMNGCEYCVRLHTAELEKLNETAERIAGVADWRGSELYTKRERAALAWTEAVTNIQEGHAPDELYEEVRAQFSGCGDGEFDAGDYDDQCVEPDCDCAGDVLRDMQHEVKC